jgi:hypothetical protein
MGPCGTPEWLLDFSLGGNMLEQFFEMRNGVSFNLMALWFVLFQVKFARRFGFGKASKE